jgi:23S rRNA pseudouridine2605 synthase
MRINRYIASATELSRRAADTAISEGRVLVNGNVPGPGDDVTEADEVTLDGRVITPDAQAVTVIFNKPRGYVVSRQGQGAQTIYELLPPEYQLLNPVGRLDKDSSGLLVLTNDGQLAHELTHPSRQKTKIYEVTLDQPLQPLHQQMITDYGVTLDDGPSRFQVVRLDPAPQSYQITMTEGRNRQIRRTFAALGYTVTELHRTHFGPYVLDDLPAGHTKVA